MAPKPKLEKQEILQAAFSLVRAEGPAQLNARQVAKALGCSTQPVFSHYANMTDLKAEVLAMAARFHAAYFADAAKKSRGEALFLQVGIAYVDFALEEPNLFRLLFLSDGFSGQPIDSFVTGDCDTELVGALPAFVNKASKKDKALFTDMWLYAHGIAVLAVTNQLQVTRPELQKMLRRVFRALVQNRKADKS